MYGTQFLGSAYRRNKAQHKAAATMQKMYLNMKACRGAILEKKNRRRNRAAIRVQTVARRRQAKKFVDQKSLLMKFSDLLPLM